jgi:hypothetical protein
VRRYPESVNLPATEMTLVLAARLQAELITQCAILWAQAINVGYLGEFTKSSHENIGRFGLLANGWGFFGTIVRPKSRGQLRLTGPNPLDSIHIEAGFLSHPDDLRAVRVCVELCREIGNPAPLRHFNKREVMPGKLEGKVWTPSFEMPLWPSGMKRLMQKWVATLCPL